MHFEDLLWLYFLRAQSRVLACLIPWIAFQDLDILRPTSLLSFFSIILLLIPQTDTESTKGILVPFLASFLSLVCILEPTVELLCSFCLALLVCLHTLTPSWNLYLISTPWWLLDYWTLWILLFVDSVNVVVSASFNGVYNRLEYILAHIPLIAKCLVLGPYSSSLLLYLQKRSRKIISIDSLQRIHAQRICKENYII